MNPAGANIPFAVAAFSALAAFNPRLLAANCMCKNDLTIRTNGPSRASWVELWLTISKLSARSNL